MKPAAVLASLALIVTLLAGCFSGHDDQGDAALAWLPCEHPYPCGDGSEWPLDLEGPFGLLRVERVEVLSHDGVLLGGFVLFPDVPGDVPLPTLLMLDPYPLHAEGLGSTQENPLLEDPDYFLDSYYLGPLRSLLQTGFAIAVFHVRGTGNSGGCLDIMSTDQQKDPLTLVEWITAQQWSNGRIGVMGLSYLSWTALSGAALDHPAVKAVLVGGLLKGLYEHQHTPQGARSHHIGSTHWFAYYGAWVAAYPLHSLTGQTALVPERACAQFAATLLQQFEHMIGDDRDAAYWEERTLRHRLPDVSAAVLFTPGFRDGNHWTEHSLWRELESAPKRGLMGQWGHTFHFDGRLADYPGGDSHAPIFIEWFDYWLKGIGEPPRIGVVDYQDSAQRWHESTAWPPAQANEEVLYLRQGEVSAEARDGPSSSFRAVPGVARQHCPDQAIAGIAPQLCGTPRPLCEETSAAGVALSFTSGPVPERTTIAGNPFAHLRLESDEPGGVFQFDLWDLAPGFHCDMGAPVGAERLRPAPSAAGAADLRFLHGNYVVEPFPVGTVTPVRVDHPPIAYVLEPGHRLAIVLWLGGSEGTGAKHFPRITLHADGGDEASHLVIPVIEGTFGGAASTLDYPPRPFVGGQDP